MSPEPVAVTFRPAAIAAVARRDDEEARAAGFAAGWAAGARAAAERATESERRRAREVAEAQARRDAQVSHAVTTLSQVAATFTARRAPEETAVALRVHEAALELAAAVLGHELRPGPDGARSILQRALALPAETGLHTVRVSPIDVAHVEDLLAEGSLALPDGVRLVADASLAPGDVVAEATEVVLDGCIGAALARARAALGDA